MDALPVFSRRGPGMSNPEFQDVSRQWTVSKADDGLGRHVEQEDCRENPPELVHVDLIVRAAAALMKSVSENEFEALDGHQIM